MRTVVTLAILVAIALSTGCTGGGADSSNQVSATSDGTIAESKQPRFESRDEMESFLYGIWTDTDSHRIMKINDDTVTVRDGDSETSFHILRYDTEKGFVDIDVDKTIYNTDKIRVGDDGTLVFMGTYTHGGAWEERTKDAGKADTVSSEPQHTGTITTKQYLNSNELTNLRTALDKSCDDIMGLVKTQNVDEVSSRIDYMTEAFDNFKTLTPPDDCAMLKDAYSQTATNVIDGLRDVYEVLTTDGDHTAQLESATSNFELATACAINANYEFERLEKTL